MEPILHPCGGGEVPLREAGGYAMRSAARGSSDATPTGDSATGACPTPETECKDGNIRLPVHRFVLIWNTLPFFSYR